MRHGASRTLMEPYPVIALSNSQRLTASTFQNSSAEANEIWAALLLSIDGG